MNKIRKFKEDIQKLTFRKTQDTKIYIVKFVSNLVVRYFVSREIYIQLNFQ